MNSLEPKRKVKLEEGQEFELGQQVDQQFLSKTYLCSSQGFHKGRLIQFEFMSLDELKKFKEMQSLNFQNIVKILDCGTNQDGKYKSVLIEGGVDDLEREISNKNSFGEKIPIKIFLDLANGIKELHDFGFDHLHLTPKAVLVFKTKGLTTQYKICGFRLAKGEAYINQNKNSYSQYSAPEQINKMKPTNQTDSWSLACIFYEMVTYNQLIEDPQQINSSKIETKISQLDESEEFKQLIRRMLIIDQEKRLSIDDVKKQLEGILKKQPQQISTIHLEIPQQNFLSRGQQSISSNLIETQTTTSSSCKNQNKKQLFFISPNPIKPLNQPNSLIRLVNKQVSLIQPLPIPNPGIQISFNQRSKTENTDERAPDLCSQLIIKPWNNDQGNKQA